MMTLDLGMYQSAGVGIAALLLGLWLTRCIPFLRRHCIPAPVTGGLLFSLLNLLLFSVWDIECNFDETIKDCSTDHGTGCVLHHTLDQVSALGGHQTRCEEQRGQNGNNPFHW